MCYRISTPYQLILQRRREGLCTIKATTPHQLLNKPHTKQEIITSIRFHPGRFKWSVRHDCARSVIPSTNKHSHQVTTPNNTDMQITTPCVGQKTPLHPSTPARMQHANAAPLAKNHRTHRLRPLRLGDTFGDLSKGGQHLRVPCLMVLLFGKTFFRPLHGFVSGMKWRWSACW